jgi:hypothetical protein
MFGLFYFVANLGRLICYKVGGILFDVERYWPFIFIGICWIFVSITFTILILLGIFEKRVTKQQRSVLVASILNKSNANERATHNKDRK